MMFPMIFGKIFGDASSKTIKKYMPIVEQVNALEQGFLGLSDAVLAFKSASDRPKKPCSRAFTCSTIGMYFFIVLLDASPNILPKIMGNIIPHKTQNPLEMGTLCNYVLCEESCVIGALKPSSFCRPSLPPSLRLCAFLLP